MGLWTPLLCSDLLPCPPPALGNRTSWILDFYDTLLSVTRCLRLSPAVLLSQTCWDELHFSVMHMSSERGSPIRRSTP